MDILGDEDGVIDGVILVEAVLDGVILVLGVLLGVILILRVIVGLILIEGVIETVEVGVTLGVALGGIFARKATASITVSSKEDVNLAVNVPPVVEFVCRTVLPDLDLPDPKFLETISLSPVPNPIVEKSDNPLPMLAKVKQFHSP